MLDKLSTVRHMLNDRGCVGWGADFPAFYNARSSDMRLGDGFSRPVPESPTGSQELKGYGFQLHNQL